MLLNLILTKLGLLNIIIFLNVLITFYCIVFKNLVFWFIDCSPTSPRNGYIQEKRFEDKKYFKIGEEINYFCG